MRHRRRDYADVNGLQGGPTQVGFLDIPRIGPDPYILLSAVFGYVVHGLVTSTFGFKPPIC